MFTIFRHYIGSCSKRLHKKSFRTLAIEIARKFSPHVLERLRDTALAASMNVDCCNARAAAGAGRASGRAASADPESARAAAGL